MQSDIGELIGQLNYLDRVHYRFMAERIDGEFRVTRLIVGPQASWEGEEYEYKDVIFTAHTTRGAEVANWLQNGAVTTWYNRSFPLMPINSYVDFSSYPSHSKAGSFILSKPFTMYRVAFSAAVPGREYEFISENAPFFLARWEAERHLLYDVAEDAVHSTWQTPEPGIYVYIEHSDAWLEKIHFSLMALEIHLGGTSLERTKLKVVGTGIQGYDDYPRQDIVTIPLPDGRPDYLKIALVQGNTWLDYYIDDKNYRSNPHNPQRTNVTFAEPEPKEKIQALIDRGEGKTIEFKAEIDLSQGKLKWLKTVAAFANGNGGDLLLGVRDEDGTVVGFGSTLSKHGSIAKLKDAITQAISDNIDPVPEIEFLDAHVGGYDVLGITIEPELSKSYAIYQNGSVPVYYIRRGATTRVADNNEVQELIKLKSLWIQGNHLSPLGVQDDLS
ncbi:MAG TPA: ATP-binding protein [Ktedonobacteraceae bacterium]|nr:ATP-binding protein [Ktedonobacteraceae bacterium]